MLIGEWCTNDYETSQNYENLSITTYLVTLLNVTYLYVTILYTSILFIC